MANQVPQNVQPQVANPAQAQVANPTQAAFLHALTAIVGMTQAQVARVTQQNGIQTAIDLTLCDKDFALDIHKGQAQLNAMVKTKFVALIEWTVDQERKEGANHVDVANFTVDVCNQWLRESRNKRARESKQTGQKKDVPKMPEPFDGRIKSWPKKKREFIAYLGQLEGVSGQPLVYVIWREEDDDAIEDAGELIQAIRNAVKHGRDYEQDNYKVFNILQLWTSGGTADTYVDEAAETKDGNGAWMNLMSVYEGDDAKEAIAREGRTIIDKTKFTKESRNFTLEDYCNKHLRANNLLKYAKQSRPASDQVYKFLQNMDNKYETLKMAILMDPTCKNSLLNTTKKLKELWQQTSHARSTTQQDFVRGDRTIGSMNSRFGRQGRAGGGRGNGSRGQGQGGGRGYGGRAEVVEELIIEVEGWEEADLVTEIEVEMICLFQVMFWSHCHLFSNC